MKDIKSIHSAIVSVFDSCGDDGIITPSVAADAVAKRPSDVHKGNCGRLLVCAGSRGLTGAAVLSTQAALRCGSGLVTLACAHELNDIFEIKLTEAMTLPVPSQNGSVSYSAKDKLFAKMHQSSAFLIGPGLSQTADIARLVGDAIQECSCPLVMDADALGVISPDPSVLKRAKCPVIITPHIGEFARLCKKETSQIINDPSAYAKEFAGQYGCIVVLKSHRTVVASPDGKVYSNLLGNSGMASGGTGDVLAGAIASFASQGRDALLSALAGVYFHSLAADIAAAYLGEYSLIASDIINCLPYAIKETQEN
ncbi:MAG: NAD(P)H-hydrate dehydratase [Clostridia bacterium]|nr:NAD(P)H-hydrate dehydratase [Clostridia bacterium]